MDIALSGAHCVIENGNNTIEDYDVVSEEVRHPFSLNYHNINYSYDFSSFITLL